MLDINNVHQWWILVMLTNRETKAVLKFLNVSQQLQGRPWQSGFLDLRF